MSPAVIALAYAAYTISEKRRKSSRNITRETLKAAASNMGQMNLAASQMSNDPAHTTFGK